MLDTRVISLVNGRGAGAHQLRGARSSSRSSKGGQGGRHNPAPFVLTLGAINPTKGVADMAKAKKKNATRAPSSKGSRKKKNGGTRVTVFEPHALKANRGRKKGKRNPAVFGHSRPAEIAGMVVGVLGGVTVVKLIPPMFPVSWTATNAMRFGIAAGVAILTGIGAHALLPTPYRDAVILGALAQTGSVGLNAVVPSISAKVNLGRVSRGVGDFVPGGFPEPNNPIWRPNKAIAAPPNSFPIPAGVNLGRYRKAY